MLLLVEDDPLQALLATEALRAARPDLVVEHAEDGQQALARLRDPAAQRPRLVLLDLNLPTISGAEVLSAVKTDARLATVPVVMLSTSSRPSDIQQCYAAGANAYVTKPGSFSGFVDLVAALALVWLAPGTSAAA